MRIKNIGTKSGLACNNSNTGCAVTVVLVLMMRCRSSMTDANKDVTVIPVTNALKPSSGKMLFSKRPIGRHLANQSLSMSVLVHLFKCYDDDDNKKQKKQLFYCSCFSSGRVNKIEILFQCIARW